MNTTQETIRFFWRHAWAYKRYTLSILLILPITIFMHQFLAPLIVSGVLQRLTKGDFTPNDFFGSFGSAILLYSIVYLIGNVALYRMLTFLMWNLEMSVTRDIARYVFNHLMQLDADFHANRFAGSLTSQTTRFLAAYQRLADTTVYSVIPLVLVFIYTIIILSPRAPIYAPILLLLALVYITVAVFSAKRIRHFNTKEAQADSQQTGYLADSLTNIMAVKSFARNKYENRRFAAATNQTLKANITLMRATVARDTAFSLVGSCFSIAAVTMAIVAVMYLKADIATAFLMLTYSLLVAQRLWDFSSKALREYNRAFGDAHDMIETLHLAPAVADNAKPAKAKAAKTAGITFKHINFAHPEMNDALFQDLNLTIKPGEKVGLIGHSGAGKTTLTRLLLRFVDVDEGEILINNQNIAKLSQESLRQQIAFVPQEPLLFHRSIKENIAYGKPNATLSEIRSAARHANALEFIEKLPKQFDTPVGERGVKLSGGQRQRIAIARAILKNAPILVLDEATSALDSESEKFIQDSLAALIKNRTSIIIAHRLSTIAKLNRILVLEDGKIVEDGSHEQLMRQAGIYAKLWSHQSGGFIEE